MQQGSTNHASVCVCECVRVCVNVTHSITIAKLTMLYMVLWLAPSELACSIFVLFSKLFSSCIKFFTKQNQTLSYLESWAVADSPSERLDQEPLISSEDCTTVYSGTCLCYHFV